MYESGMIWIAGPPRSKQMTGRCAAMTSIQHMPPDSCGLKVILSTEGVRHPSKVESCRGGRHSGHTPTPAQRSQPSASLRQAFCNCTPWETSLKGGVSDFFTVYVNSQRHAVVAPSFGDRHEGRYIWKNPKTNQTWFPAEWPPITSMRFLLGQMTSARRSTDKSSQGRLPG
jgi:hypothetical protein